MRRGLRLRLRLRGDRLRFRGLRLRPRGERLRLRGIELRLRGVGLRLPSRGLRERAASRRQAQRQAVDGASHQHLTGDTRIRKKAQPSALAVCMLCVTLH